MSALPLLLESPDTHHLTLQPVEHCRFCHCMEAEPCAIPVREDRDGNFYLVTDGHCEITDVLYCSWFVPRVCSAPECMAKFWEESRVRLFDAQGKRA